MNSSSSCSASSSTNTNTLARNKSIKRRAIEPLRIIKHNRRNSYVHAYSEQEEVDDLEWYSGQLSPLFAQPQQQPQFFTIVEPAPTTTPTSPLAATCASPSAQLDPQFPRSRVYPSVPSYSPPPPPAQPKRLPPRMSIPIDMELYYHQYGSWEDDVVPAAVEEEVEAAPVVDNKLNSIAEELEEEDVEFTVEFDAGIDFVACTKTTTTTTILEVVPTTVVEEDFAPSVRNVNINMTPPRVLRSRWSSSTLAASLNETAPAPSPSKGWKGRLVLGFSSNSSSTSSPKNKKPRVHYEVPTTPNTRRRRNPLPFLPSSPAFSSSSSDTSSSPRRSTSSRSTSSASHYSASSYADSDASASSGGLRRKPIPVEMFLRSTV